MYLRKIYRRLPLNYQYELTSDIKEAGLFFPDQFKMIREVIPGKLYKALATNLTGSPDFQPL